MGFQVPPPHVPYRTGRRYDKDFPYINYILHLVCVMSASESQLCRLRPSNRGNIPYLWRYRWFLRVQYATVVWYWMLNFYYEDNIIFNLYSLFWSPVVMFELFFILDRNKWLGIKLEIIIFIIYWADLCW